jgi:hypothetical protein
LLVCSVDATYPPHKLYKISITEFHHKYTPTMDYKIIDGELTGEKLDKMETLQLVIRLFSNYVKDLGSWIKILWALLTRYFILFLCVLTYLSMLKFQPTRMILIAIYIFFAIFWSFFPYAFKCLMIYQITSISYCIHALGYAVLGLISWIIALSMYNTEQFEQVKSGNIRVK